MDESIKEDQAESTEANFDFLNSNLILKEDSMWVISKKNLES